MARLSDLVFAKVLAYPIVNPSLEWWLSALLVWDEVQLIWPEEAIFEFGRVARSSHVFLEAGLAQLKSPKGEEMDAAVSELHQLGKKYPRQLPTAGDPFSIYDAKVRGAFWAAVSRDPHGYLWVDKGLGHLYLGLLASQMASRPDDPVPTLSTRIEEPLLLSNASLRETVRPPAQMTASECIAIASFSTIHANGIPPLYAPGRLCEGVLRLRELDSWQAWRARLLEYRTLLQGNPSMEAAYAVRDELVEAVEEFKRDANRKAWIRKGKVALTVSGAAAGFFVASLPGALVGALAGLGMLAFDSFDWRKEDKKRGSKSPEQFVLEAQATMASTYQPW